MIRLARELTLPSFAAYLEFACLTGMRPSELDALTWDRIDFRREEIDVALQWSARSRTFTAPKYGPYTIALVRPAQQVLLRLPRQSSYVFTTLRGTHYTPSSRLHHWNRVRAAAGLGDVTLYMATRHYFGWYATNVLDLPPHVIAEQLGHRDGGHLVATLYGHMEQRRARQRIRAAFDGSIDLDP